MKELEQVLRLWNVMSDGSVECILSQKEEMLSVHITSTTITIDIRDPSGVEFISPFVKKNMEQRMSTKEYVKNKKSIILGLLGSMKAKTDDFSKNLAVIQDIANILAENEKDLIISEKGKQLARLGYGVDSLGMRLLSLEHIEVNDITALKRLMDKMKADRGE
ncbi:MAG: hypothetical protein JSW28_05445 [Thermoplasmata archaeon]|nr:MAG: hypothetical protein JSW28_05445 [Thermoplasmata archaeon]